MCQMWVSEWDWGRLARTTFHIHSLLGEGEEERAEQSVQMGICCYETRMRCEMWVGFVCSHFFGEMFPSSFLIYSTYSRLRRQRDLFDSTVEWSKSTHKWCLKGTLSVLLGGEWGLWGLPEGWGLPTLLGWLGTWPGRVTLALTIPDCREKRWRSWYPLTFLMCIAWIASLSYVVSWMMTVIGE
jgi:hypothetical protein